MNIRPKTIYLYLCALLLVGGMVALPGTARADGEPDYIPREIVVKLFSAADLAAVAADYTLDPSPLNQFGSRPIYVLHIDDGQDAPKKAEAMAGDSRVQYVEPNHRYSAPEGQKRSSWARVEDASDYAEQWAADKIRLSEAHRVARGAGVLVAVLDTGVDATHAALAGKLVSGYDFVDMDTDPSEVGVAQQDVVYGHGTHVAGIVALTAPDAKIMPVRVLDRNGDGNVWVLAEALGYAVNPDGDLTTDDGATVINLSLSTLRRTAFLDEIIDLVTCPGIGHDNRSTSNRPDGAVIWTTENGDECLSRRGAVIVAAAGNNGSTTKEYPAAEDSKGLLAVAAMTQADSRAAYSNYGSWVAVGAPGDAILSTVPGNQWGAWSGTSMAAPFVAGLAALVQSFDAQLTPDQVARRITDTAHEVGGDVRWRIDAAAALSAGPDAGTNPILFLPMLSAGRE